MSETEIVMPGPIGRIESDELRIVLDGLLVIARGGQIIGAKGSILFTLGHTVDERQRTFIGLRGSLTATEDCRACRRRGVRAAEVGILLDSLTVRGDRLIMFTSGKRVPARREVPRRFRDAAVKVSAAACLVLSGFASPSASRMSEATEPIA